MAAITLSSAGVTRFQDILGRQGADTFSIAGDTTSTMMIDTDTRWGTPLSAWAGGMSTITPSSTLGGSWVLEGRYVRIIPYNTGTGSVPAPGTAITQGSASGNLIGVYSALNVAPESVGATMPASGFIKINQWNDVAYTASALTVAATAGAQIVPANVSGMEGTLAATDFTVTAGTATLTNSSTYAQAGSKSLRIATTSTTTCTVKMANGTRFAIGAGLQVTVSGYIRGSDVKSCTLAIEWFDSTNTTISTTTIQTQNCTTTGFTQYTAAAVTAPANTRWASINVTVTSPTNGGFYYVDELTATHTGWSTGATATAADRVGWIEPIGVESTNNVIVAAGQTYYSDRSMCKGSWYEIGTTDGNRATTYQIPTNGGLSYHGGVLVDKAAAVNISSASWSGGVATFNTSSAHGLTTGDRVFIGGVLPRLYTSDINNIEACTVVDSDTFTIQMTSDPGTYTSGGTVAAVEWYPTTTNLNTTIRTDAVAGKVCWLDSATGLLRFGNDNVTSTGGYIPATGLKVRIPNVMTAAVAIGYATPLTNALAAASTSRCRFYAGTTTGSVVASQMSGTWSNSVIQNGEYCYLNDCVWVGNISFSSQQARSIVTFNCTGGNATSTTTGVQISTHSSGYTIQDCTISVGDVGTARNGIQTTSCRDVIISNNKIIGTGDRTTICWGLNFSIMAGATITDTLIINCGGIANVSQASNATLTDTTYWGSGNGTGGVPTANAQKMITFTNVSTNWVIDGITISQAAPFNIMRDTFVSTGLSSDNITIRNVGSYATPINSGTDINYDKAWTRVTTTATVTHTAHGLRTNDIIWVNASTNTSTSPVSSTRGTITAAAKTVTVVDADTFTFTCLNAGPASGTLDYFAVGTVVATFNIGTKDFTAQNVHIIGSSVAPMIGSSVSDNVRFENCTLEYRGPSSSLSRVNNNQKFTSGSWSTYEYSQPSTALGIHLSDYWVRPTTTPGTDAVVSGATWSRSGTLCTITKANHGLTDNTLIYIENSSNTAALVAGYKWLSIVVVDKNTFTIDCVNSGSTSGTVDYRIAGDGYLLLSGNSRSATTLPYVSISGSATFTGTSSLYAPAVNDQYIWESPDYMIGWDHFAHTPVFIYGTNSPQQKFDLYYQINTGSGWSSYKNLSYIRAGGGGSASSTTVTMTSTTGVNVDDYVFGIGVAGGAKVVSVDNATTITVSIANTGAVSGNLEFCYQRNEATFPSTGFKIRIKMVTNTTNTSAIYNIIIGLVSTETTRAYLYDQTTNYTLTLDGLVSGSDIVVLEAGTSTPRVNVDNNSGTTYGYVHSDAITGTDVDICVYKTGYVPYIIRGYTLTSDDTSLPIQQMADRNYSNP